MLRQFLILSAGDPSALDGLLERTQAAIGWEHVIKAPGFAILCRSIGDVLQMPGGRGFIIGTLFSKHGPARSISGAEPSLLDELAQPDPVGILRDRFWGGYVALLVDGGTLSLLRDPSGAMPCYHATVPGGWAAASDVPLLVKVGLIKPTIAWDELPRYLAARDLPATATAIKQVREILPGTYERLENGASETVSFWSPWKYVPTDESRDTAQEAERLRRTVDHCVASWGSTADLPLLTLSGGLDSSIVAAALGHSRRRFACVTIGTVDGLGDERNYALAMAQAVGSPLVEADYDQGDIDLSLSAARHFPKPIGQIHETAYHAIAMRVANSLHADAIYSGNGGDNVFYNSSSVRPLLDCLRAYGPGFALIRTLRDIADKNEVSKRIVLWEALRQYRNLARPYAWQQNLALMTFHAKQQMLAHPPSHPWLEQQDRSRPGKAGHVAFLLRVQNHLEGYFRAFDMPLINPLMSQPIVELALSIPSWHMVEGGRDRAVARRAYHDALPPPVRDRRRKGSPSSFAIAVLRAKRAEVRERLMDGELVTRGFIDEEALATELASEPGTGLGYMRILALLDMEAWIAHWQGLTAQQVELA